MLAAVFSPRIEPTGPWHREDATLVDIAGQCRPARDSTPRRTRRRLIADRIGSVPDPDQSVPGVAAWYALSSAFAVFYRTHGGRGERGFVVARTAVARETPPLTGYDRRKKSARPRRPGYGRSGLSSRQQLVYGKSI